MNRAVKIFSILLVSALTLVGISVSITRAQFSVFIPAQGGTGTSTAPSYGQMLVGNAGGTYTLTATSSLGISSTDIGTVSTSSTPTIGQLSYWTSAGYPSLLGTVATTTLTASSPLSLSNPVAKVGGSNSTLTLDTSGTWSGLAGTASALSPGANINGTAFTGASNITITAASSTLLADANTFSNVGTTTFSGNAYVVGNLQVDGAFFAPVTLVASGNTTINGALTVTGATTLATSLVGAISAASGVISAGTLTVANGGTGVPSFTADRLLYSNSAGTAIAYAATSTLNIGGNANTATALAANGANCSSGNYPLGVNASGAVEDCTAAGTGTVTSIATTWPITGGTITTTGTLSFGGLATSSAISAASGLLYATGVNTLASIATSSPFNWTGLNTFSNASSTQFSAGTNTFYINSAGRVQAKDTTNNWSGVISPTRFFVLGTGTTTTWTASTTNSAYSPFLVMPFAGTLQQVRCQMDSSFLGVNVKIAGIDVAPAYFIASSSVGIIKFTSANTFTAGQKILANFGTTTTATATSTACTFDATETP